MSRERNLVKNTGILAIGQLSSKVFTFLLLPVYTSLLLPDDYGTVDVLQTIISLVLYIVTMQLESAVFRYIIDDREDRLNIKQYVSSAFFAIAVMASATTIVSLLANFFFIFPHVELFIFSIWAQSVYFLLSNVARGLGKNVDYSIASFIVTLSSLLVNIFLIVLLKIGAASILVALIVSNTIGSFYFFTKLKLWNYIGWNAFNIDALRSMLKYSLPLIPNAISWWVANTSDRILILFFLGSGVNGIYAAANKIPTIYTTIFSVFNLAWSESVSLSMKDNDSQVYINSMMNKSYKFFSFLNFGIVICMSFMFDVLIGSNYADSYNHIYILLIAIFVNSMCSLMGGILTGLKDSKAIGWTTLVGAMVNFLVNICLINSFGIYAASISTLVSYIVIFICRYRVVKRSIKITISRTYTLQFIVAFVIITIAYFMRNNIISFIVLGALIVWGTAQNREILYELIKKHHTAIEGNKYED